MKILRPALDPRRVLGAVLIVGMLGAPSAASFAAEDEPGAREQAEKMARDAMERMMRALEMMLQSIPQYELPEVTDDGDIIIRRKRHPDTGEEDRNEDVESDTTQT